MYFFQIDKDLISLDEQAAVIATVLLTKSELTDEFDRASLRMITIVQEYIQTLIDRNIIRK